MIVSGIFIVDSLTDDDSQGFATVARSHNQMNEGISVDLHLPPYLRPSRCDIKAGSKVFAFADTVTGMGAALVGLDCDVTFTDKNDYHYTKTLTVDGAVTMKDKLDVTKDIKSTSGDVVATTISLKGHTHPITAAQFSGTINPQTGAAEGSISGNTGKPV